MMSSLLAQSVIMTPAVVHHVAVSMRYEIEIERIVDAPLEVEMLASERVCVRAGRVYGHELLADAIDEPDGVPRQYHEAAILASMHR